MSDANASLDDRDSAEDTGGCRVDSRVGSGFLCWCDGTACSNPTDKPFTVCDECKKFGHRPLPHNGLTPEDVMFDA